jgi:hypothetical protein
MVTQVAAFLLALTPVAWADPSCVVHGMAYSQESSDQKHPKTVVVWTQ